MTNQSQIGANILKRTIEYLCTDQWTEDRADALEIINLALEKCFADESSDEHKRIARKLAAQFKRELREYVKAKGIKLSEPIAYTEYFQ